MKKLLALLVSVVLIVTSFAGCTGSENYTVSLNAETGDFSVVSFNVAAPWGSLLDNTSSSARVKRFAGYMNAVKPDLIGTQEMNSQWLGKLGDLMSDYDSYGVVRGGDENEKKSEMNAVFWLKDRFECIKKDTFWLSETPDKESRYDGAGCNRVCTYVLLKDKTKEDEYVLFLNTHLDNASEEARNFGAQVITKKLQELNVLFSTYKFKTVLTGDFNDYIESEACQTFATEFNVAQVEGNTYNEWGNITEGEPIDFVFTSGKVNSAVKLDDISNGYISDHYGVYAVIE